MSRINTIFFDWGGVIADDPGDGLLRDILRDIGATEDQVEEIYFGYMRDFMCGKISEAEYWQQLGSHYGLGIHDTISDEFMKWRGQIVNERVLEVVDEAKAKGLQTAMLSNIIEPSYNILAKAGHLAHFDVIVASCKVGLVKPQPEIYQLALEQLQTTAEQSLFIDDKQRNLDPAAAMGFHVILAQNPTQIITDLKRYIADN